MLSSTETTHAKLLGAIYPATAFYANDQVFADNLFIDHEEAVARSKAESTAMAQTLHDDFTSNLTLHGISVERWCQTIDAPDSIFPDWFITVRNPVFPNGVVIFAAMHTEARRREREEPEIQAYLHSMYGDTIDLTRFEGCGAEKGKALECKGALVTDWANGKIYCSLSSRADEEVFAYMISELN